MDEIICDIQKLLTDIAADVKSGTKADLRRAEKKSARIAALASTLTLMLQMRATINQPKPRLLLFTKSIQTLVSSNHFYP